MSTQRKTFILFAGIDTVMIVIGFLFAGLGGALIFFLIASFIEFFIYWFGDKIVLSLVDAVEVDIKQSPQVYQMVVELSQKMGIPTPKLFVCSSPQPNSFATGRNPAHSTVCFTSSIVQALTPAELQAVIAHELAHIKNRDVFLATSASVMAGAILAITNLAWFGMGQNQSNNRQALFKLLLLIATPPAAALIRLGISKNREFGADAGAAAYTKQPDQLTSALIKLEGFSKQLPLDASPALSSLFIVNPFVGTDMLDRFSTHPAIEARMEKLKHV